MKINIMKWIDRYPGQLVCLLLNLVYFCSNLFMGRRKVTNPKRILVMKFFGMGSIVLASPFFKRIKERFPGAKICFLTFSSNAEICKRLEVADRYFFLRTNNFFVFTWDFIQNLIKLRRLKLDLVFDLEFFARFSTSVAYLSGATLRVGYYMNLIWRGNLLTHQVHYNSHKHISEVFMALLNSLGREYEVGPVSSPKITHEEKKELRNVLRRFAISPARVRVLLNVNASSLSLERRWPAENYIILLEKLAKKFPDTDFILIGSPAEKEYTDSIFKDEGLFNFNNVYNLAGEFSIGGLLALIQSSLLLITNDSGPLHLAASLNLPTLSIFGPESPLRYAPPGDGHTIFYKGIYCSPCLNVYNAKTAQCQGNNRCMREIKVEDVYPSACLKIKVLQNKITIQDDFRVV
ncbi:glycosyltransferase family 9 protein [Candidatus Riflebacteria bacterium]